MANHTVYQGYGENRPLIGLGSFHPLPCDTSAPALALLRCLAAVD